MELLIIRASRFFLKVNVVCMYLCESSITLIA